MKQYSKVFHKECLGDTNVDKKLNLFLEEHPNYTVSNISYNKESGRCSESLFVIFNVEEMKD